MFMKELVKKIQTPLINYSTDFKNIRFKLVEIVENAEIKFSVMKKDTDFKEDFFIS